MAERIDRGRRGFLKAVGGTVAAVSAAGAQAGAQPSPASRVAGLTAPKLDVVRWGLVGVGERGLMHAEALLKIEGCAITAICDPWAPALEKALATVTSAGRPRPAAFGDGQQDYLRLFDRSDVDAVILSTPWEQHVAQAVAAMRAGKHVFIEVPAAVTLDECWQLVDTAEATRRHCMMLENVCYGRDELMVLNMCRQGLFGDLTHAEAAYIHDLRFQAKQIEWGTGSWRLRHYERRNGNVYPTHGLGPVAQYLDVNRGDAFTSVVSMSSPSLGLAQYAAREFAPDHARNRARYRCGDMNTSLLQTSRGLTVMVQHDVSTPRPYSRHNYVQGTRGAFAGFPSRLAVEGRTDVHTWDTDLTKWRAEFDHPLWTKVGAVAERVGGHGGMDFVMLWRIVQCLREGLAMDQDVYDAATWSAVAPLSELSVARGGSVVDVPDFTRGGWRAFAPLGIVS